VLPGLSDDDKANLAKALSGFANTDGGLVVWGVKAKAATKDDPDVAIELKPISRLKTFQTGLNAVAGGLCQPPLPGVENRAVATPGDEDVGYVVTVIPPRRDSLVQATAKTCKGFFIRSGSGFHQLPEPLIAAFYRRSPSPLLRLEVQFAKPEDAKYFEQVKNAENWEQVRNQKHPWGKCEYDRCIGVVWRALLRNEGLGSATETVIDITVSGATPWEIIQFSVKTHQALSFNTESQVLIEPHPSSHYEPQSSNRGVGRILEPIHPGNHVVAAKGIMHLSVEHDAATEPFELEGSAFALDSPPFRLQFRSEGDELKSRYADVIRMHRETAPPANRVLDKPQPRIAKRRPV
jgi:hypothetical protein